MSLVHVVAFGRGRARRYLAQADGAPVNGRRPFVWVKDLARAEKFGSAAKARTFTLEALGHAQWDVILAPMRGRPPGGLGGTPVAMLARS